MILLRKRSLLAVLATAGVLLGPATTHAQQQLPCDTSARGYAITPLVDMIQTLFVPHDFRLFLPHNFHTASPPPPAGIAPLSDLAYVSTQTDLEGHDRQVLNILLASGDGCFAAPSQPDQHPPSLLVGDKPSLIASDTLKGDAHADIAIIDTQVDQFNRSAKLRESPQVTARGTSTRLLASRYSLCPKDRRLSRSRRVAFAAWPCRSTSRSRPCPIPARAKAARSSCCSTTATANSPPPPRRSRWGTSARPQ